MNLLIKKYFLVIIKLEYAYFTLQDLDTALIEQIEKCDNFGAAVVAQETCDAELTLIDVDQSQQQESQQNEVQVEQIVSEEVIVTEVSVDL